MITQILEDRSWYTKIGIIIGLIAAVITWIYSTFQWGFLLGIAIGWLPAAILGALTVFLWLPIIILFSLSLIVVFWNQFSVYLTYLVGFMGFGIIAVIRASWQSGKGE
jgi:hypothetical protein